MKTTLLILTFFLSSTLLWSQKNKPVSIPMIGEDAPAFRAASTNDTIDFPADYGRTWKILFAHPRDFTPVCSSELLELAHLQKAFDALDARLVIVSTDKLSTHYEWKAALEQTHYQERGTVGISFPLVEDHDYSIVESYGMVHPQAKRGKNIRGVFFIDRDNKVRAIAFYPVEVGRSSTEILRTLQALQTTDDDYNVVTPSDWMPGDPVMINYVSPLIRENMEQEGTPYFEYNWFMVYRRDRPHTRESSQPQPVPDPFNR